MMYQLKAPVISRQSDCLRKSELKALGPQAPHLMVTFAVIFKCRLMLNIPNICQYI